MVTKVTSAEGRREQASQGNALPDGSFPIPDVNHLRKAIKLLGNAKDRSKALAHIKKRAKALGAEDLVKDLSDFGDGIVVDLVSALTESVIDLASSANRNQGVSGSGKAFDETKYARNPMNGKFSAKFNSNSPEYIAARRKIEGDISNLQVGGTFTLPGDAGWVRRTPEGYMVQGGAGIRKVVGTLSEAIETSAAILAGKLKELGGKSNV